MWKNYKRQYYNIYFHHKSPNPISSFTARNLLFIFQHEWRLWAKQMILKWFFLCPNWRGGDSIWWRTDRRDIRLPPIGWYQISSRCILSDINGANNLNIPDVVEKADLAAQINKEPPLRAKPHSRNKRRQLYTTVKCCEKRANRKCRYSGAVT